MAEPFDIEMPSAAVEAEPAGGGTAAAAVEAAPADGGKFRHAVEKVRRIQMAITAMAEDVKDYNPAKSRDDAGAIAKRKSTWLTLDAFFSLCAIVYAVFLAAQALAMEFVPHDECAAVTDGTCKAVPNEDAVLASTYAAEAEWVLLVLFLVEMGFHASNYGGKPTHSRRIGRMMTRWKRYLRSPKHSLELAVLLVLLTVDTITMLERNAGLDMGEDGNFRFQFLRWTRVVRLARMTALYEKVYNEVLRRIWGGEDMTVIFDKGGMMREVNITPYLRRAAKEAGLVPGKRKKGLLGGTDPARSDGEVEASKLDRFGQNSLPMLYKTGKPEAAALGLLHSMRVDSIETFFEKQLSKGVVAIEQEFAKLAGIPEGEEHFEWQKKEIAETALKCVRYCLKGGAGSWDRTFENGTYPCVCDENGIRNDRRKKGSQDASGLKWREKGSEKPHKGIELVNAELSKALQQKAEFTQDEWKQFGVEDLSAATFIEVGGTSGTKYFQPAEVGALGSKWINMGQDAPTRGRKLTNVELSRALGCKVAFTAEELAQLLDPSIAPLQPTDYINVDGSYFQPAKSDELKLVEHVFSSLLGNDSARTTAKSDELKLIAWQRQREYVPGNLHTASHL